MLSKMAKLKMSHGDIDKGVSGREFLRNMEETDVLLIFGREFRIAVSVVFACFAF